MGLEIVINSTEDMCRLMCDNEVPKISNKFRKRGKKMSNYKITVYASYETEVEANTKEEAEEIAVEEAPFPYVDYCETEEIE